MSYNVAMINLDTIQYKRKDRDLIHGESNNYRTIGDLPANERPRERLLNLAKRFICG